MKLMLSVVFVAPTCDPDYLVTLRALVVNVSLVIRNVHAPPACGSFALRL